MSEAETPQPAQALQPKTTTDSAATAHAAPGDQEEVYFEGSPPVRARGGLMIGCFLIFAALWGGGIGEIATRSGPWWVGLVLIVLGAIALFVPKLLATTLRYRVTNYRIDYERGVLGKSIDTLELWHVEDLRFHQTLLDRIFNIGTITVVSHDDVMPQLELRGIPNPRPLFETLKQRVIAVKRQRGVIKMDPG